MSLYLDDQQKKNSFTDILTLTVLFLGLFYLFTFFTTKEEDVKNIDESVQSVETTTSKMVPVMGSSSIIKDDIEEIFVHKETDRYLLDFSNKTGTLTSIAIKDFKNSKGEFFNLTPDLSSLDQQALSYRLSHFDFMYDYKVKETDNSIIFTKNIGSLILEKTYTFSKDKYSIHLQINITNNSNESLVTDAFLGWGKSLGPFVPKEDQVQYDTALTQAYYDSLTQKEYTLTKGQLSEIANLQWVGIDNRYFLMAIMPEQTGASLVNLKVLSDKNPFSQFMEIGNRLTIAPKSTVQQGFNVYIGPKKKEILSSFNSNLERVVERGWFFFPLLGSVLIAIVTFIKGIVGSYGVAIIIFAILLRILFHPLNIQSMVAMSRQGELQGKIQAIKEKYPDKQVQNTKIMELYKTEQVSFLKGCLPLVIQIPFFITFYQELPHLIDLAQSKFLWIKDLSSPDTLYTIDAFKNFFFLPYHINILPIIITIATLLQMKLASKNQKTVNMQAKMMMYFMPLIFLFILWNAPSALNLYWLAQTVATMGTQAYFNKNKDRILEKNKLKKKSKKVKR